MATIKSGTDLSQSKKLAEFLPIESADMYYSCGAVAPDVMTSDKQDYKCYTICWSLAALLGVLPEGTRLLKSINNRLQGDTKYHCDCPKGTIDKWCDNPVDACYELILQLHKLKKL